MLSRKAIPFIVPFVVLVFLIPAGRWLGLSVRADLLVRLLLPGAAVAYYWRELPSFRPRHVAASSALGLAVLVVWIAPDLLFPAWRSHWLLQNPFTGHLAVTMSSASLGDPLDLLLRSLRACTVVAIVEELFWRGWLMRWLIRDDFEAIPIGTFQRRAFLLTAVLFAVEHGPYWDVGLAAGLMYNWWATRVKNVGDLILAHGVTNAALAAFVIATKRWEFWM